MKIKVTKEHIENGVREDCLLCPVATAVQEKIGKYMVTVRSDYIYINGETYPLTPETGEFVHMFDNGYEVAPFEFELPLNQDSV